MICFCLFWCFNDLDFVYCVCMQLLVLVCCLCGELWLVVVFDLWILVIANFVVYWYWWLLFSVFR